MTCPSAYMDHELKKHTRPLELHLDFDRLRLVKRELRLYAASSREGRARSDIPSFMYESTPPSLPTHITTEQTPESYLVFFRFELLQLS